MTGETRYFGAAGLRGILAAFGRFDRQPRSAGAPPPQPLTQEPPVSGDVSFSRTRLKLLSRELLIVLEGYGCPVGLRETPTLHLAIGQTGVIEIDRESGLFLFSESDVHGAAVLVTADQDRLIDQALGHFLRRRDGLSPQAINGAVRTLVGRSVGEVEHHLILHTLRHCHGNRTHAARFLGISVRTLRNKLRGYWLDGHCEGERT